MSSGLSQAERTRGIWLIVLSACSFGALPIFARLAYAGGADIYGVLMLRYALAGILLLGYALFRKLVWPNRRSLFGLILLGAIGYVGQSYCYFLALEYAPASLAALLLYTYPVIVTLLASVFLGEKLTPLKLSVLALCVLGALLTTAGPLFDAPSAAMAAAFPLRSLGIAFGLGSALIYAIYIMVGARLTGPINPVICTAIICLSASFTFLVILGVRFEMGHAAQFPVTWAGWGGVMGVTLVSTVVAVMAFFAGLRRLGASMASMLSALEPVVTVLLASVLLAESLGAAQWLGGSLILSGVVWLAGAERWAMRRPLATPA